MGLHQACRMSRRRTRDSIKRAGSPGGGHATPSSVLKVHLAHLPLHQPRWKPVRRAATPLRRVDSALQTTQGERRGVIAAHAMHADAGRRRR